VSAVGSMSRPVIIGAGHNGLVTAFYLAKAGLRPLVLERRGIIGGIAITTEIHPGFRVPTLAHACAIDPEVARDMDLAGQGVRTVEPDPVVFAPMPDGRALWLFHDHHRSTREIARLSPADAERYLEFAAALAAVSGVLADLRVDTPPPLDKPSIGALWDLLQRGRKFRALGRDNAHRLLRWLPMSVADLVSDWFESDPLRAIIAARALVGLPHGPRAAGTSLSLLWQAAIDPNPAGRIGHVIGGPGMLTAAMAVAASGAGAEIRRDADVARIEVNDAGVRSVVLANGDEIEARSVISSADPKRTFLSLVDAAWLDPDFRLRVKNYRTRGAVAKVNLALGGLPSFTAARSAGRATAEGLRGRIHIGATLDDLERAADAAKYGEPSPEPVLDVTIPTLADPSLAPEGRHVMSVFAQFAPYDDRERDVSALRETIGLNVVRTLTRYAPDLPSLIVAGEVFTPADLEATYGLTGGHLFHGEHAIDQLFLARPLLGWSDYRTPIDGLYLCGAGTHPGGGVTGRPGFNAAREILKDLGKGR
jgi:phytoene dehydrogenase-like protein